MSALHIRRAQADDVAALVALWVRSRREAMPALEERLGYTEEQNLAYFRDVVMRETMVWAALWDGVPVALLAMNGAFIEQLYVDPPWQRRGVGRALLEVARAESPHGLSLHAHQANRQAREFYEELGFVAVAFGHSPPPESEPDITYVWRPAAGSGTCGRGGHDAWQVD